MKMVVVDRGEIVTVTLSRRNLVTLLNKLDRPDSLRTLYRDTDDGMLIVKAETDDEHYQDREPGPVLDVPDDRCCGGGCEKEAELLDARLLVEKLQDKLIKIQHVVLEKI